eukprot:TRINITY_DN6961_c0_g1_i1.p1 TRINITY_DN6961_c0_g1~~TRINITY_DN6961_c0_g1_i1.p1  ORF type:complete len:345 (-),score=95.08 TRINITY_DN6961_c0_g1_i1:288-1187(-)
MAPFLDPVTAACEKNEQTWAYVSIGFAPVDSFTCLITRFFQLSNEHLIGRLVVSQLFNLFVAWLVWAGVESGRPGSRWFAGRWMLGVTLAVVQLAGISVAVPLLWAPSLLASGRRASDARPSRAFVLLVAALVAIQLPVFYASLLPVSASLSAAFCFAFNYVPIAVAFALPWLAAVLPAVRATTPKTVIAVANFFAGVTFVFHVLSVSAVLLQAHEANADLLASLRSVQHYNDYGTFAVYFLLVDLVVLLGALLAVVLLQSGAYALLRVVLRTAFVGPAAALLWQLADRDEQLVHTKTH